MIALERGSLIATYDAACKALQVKTRQIEELERERIAGLRAENAKLRARVEELERALEWVLPIARGYLPRVGRT